MLREPQQSKLRNGECSVIPVTRQARPSISARTFVAVAWIRGVRWSADLRSDPGTLIGNGRSAVYRATVGRVRRKHEPDARWRRHGTPPRRPAGKRREFFALATTDDEVSDDGVIKRRQGSRTASIEDRSAATTSAVMIPASI